MSGAPDSSESSSSNKGNLFQGVRANLDKIQSAVNVECLQLLRLLWNLHEDCHDVLHNLRLTLTHVRIKNRGEDGWRGDHPFVSVIQALGKQIKWTCDSVTNALSQFITLSQFQSHCKLILYSKLKQAKQVVEQGQLAVLYHTFALIDACLQLLVQKEYDEDEGKEEVERWSEAIFQLLLLYNTSMTAALKSPVDSALISCKTLVPSQPGKETERERKKREDLLNRIKIVTQLDGANHNDSPLLRLSLKTLGGGGVLEIIAAKQSLRQSLHFCHLVERSWTQGPSGSNWGWKVPGGEGGRFSKMDVVVNELLNVVPMSKRQKGGAGVKEEWEEKTRGHLLQSFEQVLWFQTGELTADVLLWSWSGGHIPMVFRMRCHLETPGASSVNYPLDNRDPSPESVAMETVTCAIDSFTQVALWDWKVLEVSTVAHKIKRPEQVLLLRNPPLNHWASDMSRGFGDVAIHCLDLVGRSCEKGESQDPSALESLLCDEASMLFRLEAILAYFHTWMVRRAKSWLNGWAIPQFVACSQRDSALLAKCVHDKKNLIVTRQLLLSNAENTSLHLAALHREMCSNDLLSTLTRLKAMPENLVLAVGPVAQTLSLATLQSYMPPPAHWRGVGPTSGLDPDKPSSYVRVFIQRVIEPVILAVVEFLGAAVQESIGKQVVQAACEAWLEFILQKRIQFSEWGAVQLLRDFMFIREWIRAETELEMEARQAVLQLEILKRCEGVAYLLLRSPGDVLGVGKPSRKNRRVAPSDSAESSPAVSANSVTEDDIPPEMYVPNQQMWLDLRLRRSLLSSCCER